MIRKLLGACAAIWLGASSAHAVVVRVSFTISSNDWMRTQGGPLPFGLSANPVIMGSVDLDDTKSGAARFVGLDYTVGSHSFSLADINTTYSWADFSYAYYDWGLTPQFALYLTGENLVASGNAAAIEQNWNALICNGCVSSSFEVLPPTPAAVPELASWATMIGGLGMVGTVARRRRRMAAHS